MITTAKIFTNGRSQAVRIPKEYRFEDEEVYINRIDDIVIITPKKKRMELFKKSLDKFTKDFMDNRNQPENQKRDHFK
jgi:antitoxin VapB